MKELIEEIKEQTEGLAKEMVWTWMFDEIEIRDFDLKVETALNIVQNCKIYLSQGNLEAYEEALLRYSQLSECTDLPLLEDVRDKVGYEVDISDFSPKINEVYEEESFAGEVEDFSNIYNYVVKEESL